MYVIDENQKLQLGVIGFLHVWKQLPFTSKNRSRNSFYEYTGCKND